MTVSETSLGQLRYTKFRTLPPHDSLDDFPTPPWATRALCDILQNPFDVLLRDRLDRAPSTGHLTCREPAANREHMVWPLSEYFAKVGGSDIHDYGADLTVHDYLFGPLPDPVDWTITNPPFHLAEQFIERALATSTQGVAMIVHSAFLEGVGRHDRLFSQTPPTSVLQFTERVVMHKGKLSAKGSTATAYCWLVWEKTKQGGITEFGWIPPCRKRFERPEDYA